MHLFALQIDWTVSLTTVVNAAVGAILIALGHGLRKMYGGMRAFVNRVDGFDERIEATAAIVDEHSLELHRLSGNGFARVSQKRRTTDKRHRIIT